MERKVLDLVLMYRWYDDIDIGDKREEYREIKRTWTKRFTGFDTEYPVFSFRSGFKKPNVKGYTHVRFRKGYTKTSMLWELKGIEIGRGKPEWGAPEDRDVFVLKLGERIGVTGMLNYTKEDIDKGLILPDSDIGNALMFTSDNFHDGSYMWLRNAVLFLSMIMSRYEGQGGFLNVLLLARSRGYHMSACVVSDRMQEILSKFGFRHTKAGYMTYFNPL